MLESDDNHLRRCHANSDSLRACITYITFLNIGRDKSLVDDLNMGQGIVSRGACLPCDPLRFSPCPEDLLRQQHLSPHHHTHQLCKLTPFHTIPHRMNITSHFTTAALSLPGDCLPRAAGMQCRRDPCRPHRLCMSVPSPPLLPGAPVSSATLCLPLLLLLPLPASARSLT